MNSLLKPKGTFWNELSKREKIEIQEQIKNITTDPNYTEYRYYRTQFGKWIICNAFAVPMKTSKVVWK